MIAFGSARLDSGFVIAFGTVLRAYYDGVIDGRRQQCNLCVALAHANRSVGPQGGLDFGRSRVIGSFCCAGATHSEHHGAQGDWHEGHAVRRQCFSAAPGHLCNTVLVAADTRRGDGHGMCQWGMVHTGPCGTPVGRDDLPNRRARAATFETGRAVSRAELDRDSHERGSGVPSGVRGDGVGGTACSLLPQDASDGRRRADHAGAERPVTRTATAEETIAAPAGRPRPHTWVRRNASDESRLLFRRPPQGIMSTQINAQHGCDRVAHGARGGTDRRWLGFQRAQQGIAPGAGGHVTAIAGPNARTGAYPRAEPTQEKRSDRIVGQGVPSDWAFVKAGRAAEAGAPRLVARILHSDLVAPCFALADRALPHAEQFEGKCGAHLRTPLPCHLVYSRLAKPCCTPHALSMCNRAGGQGTLRQHWEGGIHDRAG